MLRIPVAAESLSVFNMNKRFLESARESVALIDLNETHSLTLLSGEDCVSFLQALSTNDLNARKASTLQMNCLLDRKGMIQNEFGVFDWKKGLALFHSVGQKDSLEEHLDQFLFAEDVEFEELDCSLYILTGPDAEQMLQKSNMDGIPLTFSGEDSFLLLVFSALPTYLDELPTLSYHSPEVQWLRIAGGALDFEKDLQNRLMNDTGLLDRYVNHDKGCYPGQEIVTRIHQRGRPAKLLRTLHTKEAWDLRKPFEFSENTKKVAELTSYQYNEITGDSIALAYVKTPFYDEIDESFPWVHNRKKYSITNLRLPYYQSPYRAAKAARTYEEGISAYHANDLSLARERFERALEINPQYGDSYEALGMVAEKEEKIEEAIGHNQKLVRILPDSVMGYTNLSRLYMLKGWINKAEEEQQRAQDVYFRLQQKNKPVATMSKDAIAEQNQKLQAEREKKRKIFEQVLEMDPEDEIAHFGLGKMFCDQLLFDKARPHLEKLLEVNPKYSAAWPLLVKAYLGLDEMELAEESILKGIEITTQMGDLMPGKQLEILKRKLVKT